MHPKPAAPKRPPRSQPPALSDDGRAELRGALNSDDHVDEAPATVYAKLLDDGRYLASVSTMYRVLREHGEVGKRRRHATHPATVKPELVATAPNVVWSWDIPKLLSPERWTWFYLYVIIDIYSRYVPGWMLAGAERANLAEALLEDTMRKQRVKSHQLTIDADRGSLMASRAEVLDAAYAAHPERFVRHPPTPPALPKAAWINKPEHAPGILS